MKTGNPTRVHQKSTSQVVPLKSYQQKSHCNTFRSAPLLVKWFGPSPPAPKYELRGCFRSKVIKQCAMPSTTATSLMCISVIFIFRSKSLGSAVPNPVVCESPDALRITVQLYSYSLKWTIVDSRRLRFVDVSQPCVHAKESVAPHPKQRHSPQPNVLGLITWHYPIHRPSGWSVFRVSFDLGPIISEITTEGCIP